jgi:hypothetical protein
MAKKELAFEASVDIGNGAKSIKTLKQDYKEAQQELNGLTVGTQEYIKQLEKLGGIKDSIGDLNAEIAAFNPEGKVAAFGNVIGGLASGFQAAQGAAALFGAEGEELQKTLLKVQAASAFADGIKGIAGLKDQFVVLGNVIKANPILLIATIIAGIGTALFALKDKIGIVGDAFDAIGDAIGWVTDKIKEFTDWIGISTFAIDEQAEATVNAAKAQQEALSQRYDDEIALAKAAGKNTEELEKKKQVAILESAKTQIEALKSAAAANGEWTDEQIEQLKVLGKSIHDASMAIKLSNEEARAEELGKVVEFNKKKEAEEEAHQKHLNDIRKLWNESYEAAREAAYFEKVEKDRAQELADQTITNDTLFEGEQEQQQNFDAYFKDLHILTEQEKYAFSMEIAQASANSMQALSDAVFAIKLGNLEKGSKAELETAKKQFKINKALAITQTVISTIMGITNALSAQSIVPEPFGTILKVANAVAVGIAGTANTAKIASQQFNSGGGGGGVTAANISSAGGGVNIAPPSTGSTLLNSDGTIKKQGTSSQPMVKAYVTETDISSTQKRVNSIEEKSQIK